MRSTSSVVAFGALVLGATPTLAGLISVPGDVPTIQDAVLAAVTGDSIVVAAGTYAEAVMVTEKSLTLLGAGAEVTRVDVLGWENPSMIDEVGGWVAGFTVTDGLDIRGLTGWFTVYECTVEGDTYMEVLFPTFGDGVAVLKRSRLQGDVVVQQDNWFSSVLIEDCELSGPVVSLDSESGISVSGCTVTGGDVYMYGEFVDVIENAFIDCELDLHVDSFSGTARDNTVVGGSGIRLEAGDVADWEIDGNVITDAEVGIRCEQDDFMFVRNNRIGRCTTGLVLDGPLYEVSGNLVFGCETGVELIQRWDGAECFVTDNTIVGCTGQALVWTCPGDEAQGVFASNLVAGNGGGVDLEPDQLLEIRCNDVWDNAGANWTGIPDPTGVDGNFSADPLFCQPALDDYTLADASPCRPGQHPDGADCGFVGAEDGPCVPVLDTPGGLDAAAHPPASGVVRVGVNPIRGEVWFEIAPVEDPRRLELFDVSGRRVDTLTVGPMDVRVHWNARDRAGRMLPSGTYYVRLDGDVPATPFVLVR